MTTRLEMEEQILESAPEWYDNRYCGIEDLKAIQEGGCSSGAYMPAVTYSDANQTMAEHGDVILDYIYDVYGDDMPTPPTDSSWSAMAVFYLSLAVELWAGGFDLDQEFDEEGE